MRLFLIIIIIILNLTTVSAQADGKIPMLRIDEVPYTPQTRRVSPCGVTLGLDPKWELETEKKEINGTLYDITRSKYTRAVADAHFKDPMMRFVAAPFVGINIYCARGTWPADDAKTRADRVAKSMIQKGYQDVKSRRFVIGGQEWHAVEHMSNEKGSFWFSVLNLYSNEGDKRLRVRFVATTNGCKGAGGILRSGAVHTVKEKDGTTYQARFGDVKTVSKKGVVCSSRKHTENRTLFNQIRRTIR